MLQFIVPESFQVFYLTGVASFLIAIIIGILMFFRRGTSVISEMYIVGAIIAFYVGGFTVTFSPVFPMCPCEVTWRSPIGLIGGWILILLSIVEYRSNRIQTSSVTESGTN